MKIISNIRYYLLLAVLLCASTAFAQDKYEYKHYNSEFCSDNWSSGDRASAKDLRETTFAAPGILNVDAGKNGGISVRGENRSDVLVRACVQAWGDTQQEADARLRNVRVETGANVRASSATGDDKFSVSYQILVPRSMNLELAAHNGGIAINSVEGNIKFETTNGGVSLKELAGDVRGRTTNGGVSVKLSGVSWRGAGLDVETTNGGVKLTMPENYAARVETGTTNGGLKSNIAALNPTSDDENKWNRKKRITADLNGGGAPIRVITTNGGVKIDTQE